MQTITFGVLVFGLLQYRCQEANMACMFTEILWHLRILHLWWPSQWWPLLLLGQLHLHVRFECTSVLSFREKRPYLTVHLTVQPGSNKMAQTSDLHRSFNGTVLTVVNRRHYTGTHPWHTHRLHWWWCGDSGSVGCLHIFTVQTLCCLYISCFVIYY